LNALEYSNKYRRSPIVPLSAFLDEHGDHCIIECKEASHQWPMLPLEISSRAGPGAVVEYLGKRSPHFVNGDCLFFVIRSGPDNPGDGTEPEMHVVVYVF
jgi:hypothetical protein